MSDSNRLQVAVLEEVSYGTTPGSGTPFTARVTSESLAPAASFIKSEEIAPDRQISDIIRTDFKVAGDLNFELSYGSQDAMMRRALLSDADWTTVTPYTATTIACTGAATLTDSANGFVTAGLFAGMWVKISGFTGAGVTANAVSVRIVTAAAGTLTIEGATLIADAAGESVTITPYVYIKNGVTLASYVIRKSFTDVTLYEVLNGMCIDGFSLKVEVGAKVTGTFNLIGKTASSTNWSGPSSPSAATTSAVFETVDHVPMVLENGSAVKITEFSFDLKNNLRARMEVGTLGTASVGTGTVNLTGSFKMYFSSVSMMDRFLANTATKFSLRLKDSSNQNYVFDIPAARITDGKRIAGGQDSDIMAEFTWEAYKGATEGYTFAVYRNGNAAT